MTPVSSWGRLSSPPHEQVFLSDRSKIQLKLESYKSGLAYGAGRSYGDSCLNPGGVLWNTRGLDKFIELNLETGRLICESGVLLRDIQALTIPSGWALPVTPGTQIVCPSVAPLPMTCMGKVITFRALLAITFGGFAYCGPMARLSSVVPNFVQNSTATVGGMGLTGLIDIVELELQKVPGPWLETETMPFTTLDDYFRLTAESEGWEHTVSWVDCISGSGGRGLFMRGNPVPLHQQVAKSRQISMPFTPPFSLVNQVSLPHLICCILMPKNRKLRVQTCITLRFSIRSTVFWNRNRMYGRRGFFQYNA